MKFERSIEQPFRILEPQLVLVIPESIPDWEIAPSKIPTAVRSVHYRYITFDVHSSSFVNSSLEEK